MLYPFRLFLHLTSKLRWKLSLETHKFLSFHFPYFLSFFFLTKCIKKRRKTFEFSSIKLLLTKNVYFLLKWLVFFHTWRTSEPICGTTNKTLSAFGSLSWLNIRVTRFVPSSYFILLIPYVPCTLVVNVQIKEKYHVKVDNLWRTLSFLTTWILCI